MHQLKGRRLTRLMTRMYLQRSATDSDSDENAEDLGALQRAKLRARPDNAKQNALAIQTNATHRYA